MPRRRRTYSRRRRGYSKRRKQSTRISYTALAKAITKLNAIQAIGPGGGAVPIGVGNAQSVAYYGENPKNLWFEMMYGPSATRTAAFEKIQRRRAADYWGPGDYRSVGKYIPRIGGAIGGGLAGWRSSGAPGMFEGAKKGWKAGARLSRLSGMGDYSTNQIIDNPTGSGQQAVMHNVGTTDDLTGDLVYSNSEFIANVTAFCPAGTQSSPFQIQGFELNPGLSTTLPFFAQLAQNFELYEPMGWIFQYKPTSGEFGNNTSNSLGKIIMATNYDPNASAFVNAVQMSNYDYANSSKPSEGMIHGVECAPQARSTRMMYVRTGVSPKDKLFTDIGTFFLATEGIPFGESSTDRSAIVGELWVTYSMRLSRSKLYQSLNENIPYAIFKSNNVFDISFALGGLYNLGNGNIAKDPASTLNTSGATVDSGSQYVITIPSSNVPRAFNIFIFYRLEVAPAAGVGLSVNWDNFEEEFIFLPSGVEKDVSYTNYLKLPAAQTGLLYINISGAAGIGATNACTEFGVVITAGDPDAAVALNNL